MESEITAQKIGLTAADIQNRDVIKENVDRLQPKDIDLLKPYAGEEWADKKIAELKSVPVEKVATIKTYQGTAYRFGIVLFDALAIFVYPPEFEPSVSVLSPVMRSNSISRFLLIRAIVSRHAQN